MKKIRNDLEITWMITLSTAHISSKTAEFLESESLVFGENYDMFKITVIDYDYGWCIKTDLDIDYSDSKSFDYQYMIPQDLVDVIVFAHKNNCHMIRLDRDGNIIDDLPTYDW